MQTAQQHNFQHVGTLEIRDNPKIEDVFSAQLAKNINRISELEFGMMCILNALEMGMPHIAIEHARRNLKIAKPQPEQQPS